MTGSKSINAPSSGADRAWTDHRSVRTSASPEQAWRAFGDARIVPGWFADEAALERAAAGNEPSATSASGEATVRPREPGGHPPLSKHAVDAADADRPAAAGDVIIHRFPAFGFEVRNEVIESDPGRRLVLRMAFPGRPPMTQEIVIRTDAGETVIEMTNSGFGEEDWEGQWQGIDSGWKLSFAQLRHYLENHFGRTRTSWLAMQPSMFEWRDLGRHFREPSLLSSWLTEQVADSTASMPPGETGASADDVTAGASNRAGPGGDSSHGIGAAGDDVRLVLRGGMPLSGRVLEDSGREILVSWSELDGTLELKAFEAGPGARMLALRASSWSAPPRGRNIDSILRTALDRLAARLA